MVSESESDTLAPLRLCEAVFSTMATDPAPLPLPFPARAPAGASAGPPGVRLGTSGFSYADWRGPFYPARLPDRQMLDYYAGQFRAVEINSTYYRIPPASTLASLARRAEGRLEFTVKTHQDLTHHRTRYPESMPIFRAALAPLREAGVLGCVLAQFPSAFRAGPDAREFLRRLAGDLAPDPVAVEFRHAGWITEETFAWLREHGIGFCAVDAPPLPDVPPPVVAVTAPVAYIRFHGRNTGTWRTGNATTRYDYLYTEDELRDWVPRVRAAAADSQRAYVFFNNHVRGQAVMNARMLADLLRG
jgi:uncharacterized protein YecE (DUF72 family)